VAVVYGVDGARGGWAVAVVELPAAGDPDGRVTGLRWRTFRGQDAAGLGDLLTAARQDGAVAIGVDCPIGLPSSAWRPCDLAAKRRLGRGSARVFLAPPRAVLAAPTYADARAVARELVGKGISAQTYGIRRIVLAVDDALRAVPGQPARPQPAGQPARQRAGRSPDGPVLEVHPELSFMAMSGRAPGDPLPSKRIPQGRRARLDAVARWVGPAALDPPSGDDHLDALAAAWSAWRWACGTAEVLGGELDEHGLPMRIVV
jgi:predicted RNase H-like nuclease